MGTVEAVLPLCAYGVLASTFDISEYCHIGGRDLPQYLVWELRNTISLLDRALLNRYLGFNKHKEATIFKENLAYCLYLRKAMSDELVFSSFQTLNDRTVYLFVSENCNSIVMLHADGRKCFL